MKLIQTLVVLVLVFFLPLSADAASPQEQTEQMISEITRFFAGNSVLCGVSPDSDMALLRNALLPEGVSEETQEYIELLIVKGVAESTLTARADLRKTGRVNLTGTPLGPNSCPDIQEHRAKLRQAFKEMNE